MDISESLIEGVKTLCWLGWVGSGQAQPREYDVSDYAAKLGERKKEILKRTRDGLDFCKG
jgi:hypothetical protein